MAEFEVGAGPEEMRRSLREIEERLTRPMVRSLRERSSPQDGPTMLAGEEAHRRAGGEFADLLVIRDIVLAHLDPLGVQAAMSTCRERVRAATGCREVKSVGLRQTSVLLPGGTRLRLFTAYVRPSLKGRVGRPRGTGKRQGDGSGAYPVLEGLGITDGVTPLTRSDISRQAVLCSGYTEAQEQLARQGLDLDISTLTRVAVSTGAQAVALRELALDEALRLPLPERSLVAGQRIRVSVDGGQTRTREVVAGARKGRNGRRPFTLQWQEPRLITVDVLTPEGEMDSDERPIYEVSLGTADEVYRHLTGLLRLIGAHQAAQVVFVSDGAEWIWNRVEALMRDAEIPKERTRLILDYYHATEHIGDALDACKSLSAAERAAVRDALNRLLLEADGVEQVITRLSGLARGRRAPDIQQEVRYLKKHAAHMRYAEWRQERVPIGSGVVESAVRRVINLRFKSASMCWRPDHLAPLMYLRAILKAGRWDDFMPALLTRRHWLRAPVTTPQPVPALANGS